jgi:hypothetical protein
MLTIRNAQLEALRAAPRQVFEDSMVAHLAKYAPKHCEVIGQQAVRTAIRLGIDRARSYGLTNKGPVRFYLESMFMFGSDFDTDPQLRWAAAILTDGRFSDQMAKADHLYETAMAFVDEIAGPNYRHAIEALRRARRIRFDELPPPGANFVDEMLARLEQIHPQKVQFLGKEATKGLITYGEELCAGLPLAPERGAGVCVAAMFAVGHGFSHDPLLPWISRTIVNPAIVRPDVRVRRLYSRIMTYLDRVLADHDAREAS